MMGEREFIGEPQATEPATPRRAQERVEQPVPFRLDVEKLQALPREERNRRVLADVQRWVEQPTPPSSSADTTAPATATSPPQRATAKMTSADHEPQLSIGTIQVTVESPANARNAASPTA